MSFLVSPGVHVKEIDLTTVVPAVATSIGAIAGPFERGDVSSIVNISSEEELIKTFGKPNSNNFEWWFTAASFLQYSDTLKVVRAESGITNAIASGTSVLIRDTDHYNGSYASGQGSVGEWAARTAGTWGNSVGVSICANSTAWEETAATTTSSQEAAGQTDISVTDASQFGVGDIVYFQESNGDQYEVTAKNTTSNVITIKFLDDPAGAGLQSTISSGTNIRRRWRFYDLFTAAPGTSAWATENGRGTGDEMHIVVYDTTGDLSGFDVDANGKRTMGVLETYANVSKNSNAKTTQGGNNYYADVIYRQSEYVFWMDHNSSGANWGTNVDGASGFIIMNGTDGSSSNAGDDIVFNQTDSGGTDSGDRITLESGTSGFSALDTPTISELLSGTDDYSVTAGELELAYDKFADTESLDVNLILAGPSGAVADTSSGMDTHGTMIIDLCELRKDCVGFISPYRASIVNVSSSITQTSNVITGFNTLPSSSYVVFDSGYKYMYDKYNDVYRYVPLNGDTGGLCANTDRVADAWYSPAGYNRGNVRGAVKLAYNPTKNQRDQLYRARVNPVVNFPGQGVVLFGDKTALSKPSAFDRINIRRLFLVLEKAIATASKLQLFEFNDEFTRAQFRNLVEPFLRDVQGRRGITDFRVIADASNNTGQVIDRNEFVADIFIKPARSINFITLNFIATRTGVAFSEVGG